jgi:hypothetical protein
MDSFRQSATTYAISFAISSNSPSNRYEKISKVETHPNSSSTTEIVWFGHRPRTVELVGRPPHPQEVAVAICSCSARPVRVAAARATSLAGSAELS